SSFYLWAHGAGTVEGGSPPAGDPPPLHPTGVPHDALRALVGDICTDALIASVAEPQALTLLLPSDENGPLAPDQAAEDGNGGVAVAALAAYTVPALRLSPTEAIDLLINLADPLPETCGDSV